MPTIDRRHAVYVGSFDPITLGHEDIIRRSAHLFDQLTIGIGINPDKQPLFTPEERMALIKEVVSDLDNINVVCFTGLTVEFVSEISAGVIVRGVRTLSDMETEFTMALANHNLQPEIETVFLMASEQYTHVSSTLIKQIARMGQKNTQSRLTQFVPQAVTKPLMDKLSQS